MPIRNRASIDGRLAELEARRDAASILMLDRLWHRLDELLGRERVTELLEGLADDAPWPAELAAASEGDAECAELSRAISRLYTWRTTVETLTGKPRSGDAD
jgi:hypothetical protein